MLRIDLSQIHSNGDTFFSSTDMGYLIFMIIGIVGYFTVPSVAGHIMHVGGVDGHSGKMTALAAGAAGGVASGATMGAAAMTGGLSRAVTEPMQFANNKSGSNSNYQKDKIGGGK